MGKSAKSYVFQYNQKGPPEWRWVILAISLKKMKSLPKYFYSEYILNILGYQVVKFDFAGVLVSRDIGLQPSPSRPFIVYSFC